MKARIVRSNPISIQTKRWATYAAAGAATALAGGNSAEAAIHYSGFLNRSFPPHNDKRHTLPLDQAGDYLVFERREVGTGFFDQTDIAYFRIFGLVAGSFRGGFTYGGYNDYVSKLRSGQNVSGGSFRRTFHFSFTYGAILAENTPNARRSLQWRDRGTGFIGFRFNNGAGLQYGWVRVRMSGVPYNAFKVVDYAYADPGEPITAGQTSSDGQASNQGSLGWLALGAVGLLAWRKNGSRSARHTKLSLPG